MKFLKNMKKVCLCFIPVFTLIFITLKIVDLFTNVKHNRKLKRYQEDQMMTGYNKGNVQGFTDEQRKAFDKYVKNIK